MIQVKNATVLAALLKWWYHNKLVNLALWVLRRHLKLFLTEGFRPATHDDDLHATKPVRALDLRSRIYHNPRAVKRDIDDNWIYDPKRPEMSCCVYHRVRLAWHFHLQVHPNTVYEPGWRDL